MPRLALVGRIVAPSISQIAVVPELSRQSRSDLPSALKSPVAAMVQVVGIKPGEAPEVGIVPFMKYIATWPVVVLRQRMSLLPSALKSPVPAISQSLASVPIPAAETIVVPYTNQIAA